MGRLKDRQSNMDKTSEGGKKSNISMSLSSVYLSDTGLMRKIDG